MFQDWLNHNMNHTGNAELHNTALHISKSVEMNNKFCSDSLKVGLQFCWELNSMVIVLM